MKESCPELKPNCKETEGSCKLDEKEAIQCECPKNTKYVKDIGCKSKIIYETIVLSVYLSDIFDENDIKKINLRDIKRFLIAYKNA